VCQRADVLVDHDTLRIDEEGFGCSVYPPINRDAALAPASTLYLGIFIAQCGFYAVGVAGLFSQIVWRQTVLRIPAFFVLVTVSTLHAWYRYARGHRILMWAPSER